MTTHETDECSAAENTPSSGESGAPQSEQIAKDIDAETKSEPADKPKEIGGRDGLDPTRVGDWEKSGRCIDF